MSDSPFVKEEEVCWTEKEDLWLNFVVKEENEEEDMTVKEVESEAVTVKEENEEALMTKEENNLTVKKEEKDAFFWVREVELPVTLEEEQENGDRVNTSASRNNTKSNCATTSTHL
ncbi:uncharacterized protein LOC105030083 isoform X2 [Esox lucius]|uniref:uncharacterized protein LOC105030083 isoform X2 n=1 Tax=Esox lucius TaxID=8010 RepID=UPI0009733F81|nr:uncharacterized protein LOC105030083 isoform X2 [Esox lucius]